MLVLTGAPWSVHHTEVHLLGAGGVPVCLLPLFGAFQMGSIMGKLGRKKFGGGAEGLPRSLRPLLPMSGSVGTAEQKSLFLPRDPTGAQNESGNEEQRAK